LQDGSASAAGRGTSLSVAEFAAIPGAAAFESRYRFLLSVCDNIDFAVVQHSVQDVSTFLVLLGCVQVPSNTDLNSSTECMVLARRTIFVILQFAFFNDPSW